MLDRILSCEEKWEDLDSDTHEAEGIVQRLDNYVVGQDRAKREVAQAISDNLHYVTRKNGPLATLLFTGPTGVGKTEIARALADFLLGDRSFLTKIPGEQFQEPHTVARLY